MLREDRQWEFVVLRRRELQLLRAEAEAASANVLGSLKCLGPRPTSTKPERDDETGTITVVLTFTETEVTAWGQSLQSFRNNWRQFPEVSVEPGVTPRARGRSWAP